MRFCKRLMLVIVISAMSVKLCAQTRPAASQRSEAATAAERTQAGTLREMDEEMKSVAERVLPAVVQISVSGFGPARSQSGNESVIERQRGLGSGVIVESDGYIVTNAHVVAGAQRIQVILTSVTTELVPYKTSLRRRQRVYEARLVGTHRMTDLALLKIEEKGLPFIPLKQEYQAQLGQTVLAVGSPEGLDHTLTRGIVSAVGRQPAIDQPMIYIQTDAPINPGNSGGALVDRDGGLVGINTFILTQGGGSEGLGFAIPEPTVRFVYEELKLHGHVRRTVIGANAQTITPTLAAGLKLSQDWGVIISDVLPEGPAEKAGLKPRDIVIAIDDRVIDSLPKFAAALFIHRRDLPVQVDVLRGPETLKLSVPAVEARGEFQGLEDLIDMRQGLIAPLGIFVLSLDQSTADALPGVRSATGVIVAGKVDYTPAMDAGLAAGDVIRSINTIVLSSVSDLRAHLERLKPGGPIVLEIERQGMFQFLALEME